MTLFRHARLRPLGATLPDDACQHGTGEVQTRRPRLLSFAGRWGRTRRWLPAEVRRLVDVGCAFGYGTAALAGRGRSARWVVGIERDARLVLQAHQRYSWLPFVRANATALPLRSGAVDAVALLDIVEHVVDPPCVVVEACRVLRGGGYLVLTVPHVGLLSAFDANNVYAALRRRWRALPPPEAYDASASGVHRHFSLREARALLAHGAKIDRVARTGVGVAELVHLLLLMTLRVLLRWRGAYLLLRPLHFYAYLLEDVVPAGELAYHLALRARVARAGSDRS